MATSADKTLLRMVFDRIDTSGDGLLQKGELLAAVQNSDIVRAMLGASKGLSGLLKPSTYASTFEALDTDNAKDAANSNDKAKCEEEKKSDASKTADSAWGGAWSNANADGTFSYVTPTQFANRIGIVCWFCVRRVEL